MAFHRVVLVLYICLGMFTSVLAQVNQKSEVVDSLLDVMFFDEPDLLDFIEPDRSFHFLYARVNYSAKTYYAGREIGEGQVNISPQLMYFNSWGLYAGLSTNWYEDAEPSISSTVASLGYSKGLFFNKKLRLRGSYDHFFYTDPDINATYFGNVSVGASYLTKYLSVQTSANFLMGGDFTYSISGAANGRFTLHDFGKRRKLQLRPGVSFYVGSEEVEYLKNTSIVGGETFAEYDYQDKMGLLNVDLRLPIMYTHKNWDFEASMVYKIPFSLDEAYSYDKTLNFNFSIGYFFSL